MINAIEFRFFAASMRPLGREIVLVPSSDSGSILTPSLLPRSKVEDVKQVRCTAHEYQSIASLAIEEVPCGMGGPIVDNGPTLALKQAAVFQTKVYVMVVVTVEKFFATGTASLDGVNVFARVDKAPLAATVIHGLEPQTVVLGFTDVAPGPHDVSYGLLDSPNDLILGHMCFKN